MFACSHCNVHGFLCSVAVEQDQATQSLCMKMQGWTRSTRSRAWRCPRCTASRCVTAGFLYPENIYCYFPGHPLAPGHPMAEAATETSAASSSGAATAEFSFFGQPSAAAAAAVASSSAAASSAATSNAETTEWRQRMAEIFTPEYMQALADHAHFVRVHGLEYINAVKRSRWNSGIDYCLHRRRQEVTAPSGVPTPFPVVPASSSAP